MKRKLLVQIGTVLATAGVILATRLPAFATESTASRPAELRKEMRQEIKDDRKELRQDTKMLRKMIGTRGAFSKVVLNAKAGDSLPTTLTVTKEGKTYTVNVSLTTEIRRRFGGKGSLADLQVNDMLDIVGKWTDEAQTTVDARVIRDESVQKRLAVFVGKVKTISGSTIVIDSVARGSQTITVSTTTKFVSRKETPLSLTDIKEGHVIRVKGVWNNQLNTVSDVSHVKDYSLPVITRPAALGTPSATNK